jgi:hypothetical protein
LVMVWSTVQGGNNSVSAGDYLDWKRQNSVFQDLVAFTGGSFSLSVSGTPEVVQTRILSPGWFNLQGIPFALGRDFLHEEGVPGPGPRRRAVTAHWPAGLLRASPPRRADRSNSGIAARLV